MNKAIYKPKVSILIAITFALNSQMCNGKFLKHAQELKNNRYSNLKYNKLTNVYGLKYTSQSIKRMELCFEEKEDGNMLNKLGEEVRRYNADYGDEVWRDIQTAMSEVEKINYINKVQGKIDLKTASDTYKRKLAKAIAYALYIYSKQSDLATTFKRSIREETFSSFKFPMMYKLIKAGMRFMGEKVQGKLYIGLNNIFKLNHLGNTFMAGVTSLTSCINVADKFSTGITGVKGTIYSLSTDEKQMVIPMQNISHFPNEREYLALDINADFTPVRINDHDTIPALVNQSKKLKKFYDNIHKRNLEYIKIWKNADSIDIFADTMKERIEDLQNYSTEIAKKSGDIAGILFDSNDLKCKRNNCQEKSFGINTILDYRNILDNIEDMLKKDMQIINDYYYSTTEKQRKRCKLM